MRGHSLAAPHWADPLAQAATRCALAGGGWRQIAAWLAPIKKPLNLLSRAGSGVDFELTGRPRSPES